MNEFNPDKWDGKGRMPMLFSRSANGAINEWQCWVDGCDVLVRWGVQGGKTQQASFACVAKNVGRANATTAGEQAVLEAISKWKKQVKKKYSMSIADLALRLPKPMLAQKYSDRRSKVVFPADVQRKLDGVRCFARHEDGKLVLRSRGGDLYDVEHVRASLEDAVPPGLTLDGELYVHGVPLQEIYSLVKKPQERSKILQFHAYDLFDPDHQEAWDARKKWLSEFVDCWQDEHAGDELVPVVSYEVSNHDEIKLLHDKFVAEGYEGAMVRNRNGTYRAGFRSADLLKVKAFEDAEFKILGWKRGRGKFKDVPIFNCALPDGGDFDVTPRGTAAVRAQLLKDADSMVGKMYTVRFIGRTEDGKPKFAVGIAVRPDGA